MTAVRIAAVTVPPVVMLSKISVAYCSAVWKLGYSALKASVLAMCSAASASEPPAVERAMSSSSSELLGAWLSIPTASAIRSLRVSAVIKAIVVYLLEIDFKL